MESYSHLSSFLVFNLNVIIYNKMFNENQIFDKPIVIDLGSANSKFGWSGEEKPQGVLRSLQGNLRYRKILRDQV